MFRMDRPVVRSERVSVACAAAARKTFMIVFFFEHAALRTSVKAELKQTIAAPGRRSFRSNIPLSRARFGAGACRHAADLYAKPSPRPGDRLFARAKPCRSCRKNSAAQNRSRNFPQAAPRMRLLRFPAAVEARAPGARMPVTSVRYSVPVRSSRSRRSASRKGFTPSARARYGNSERSAKFQGR